MSCRALFVLLGALAIATANDAVPSVDVSLADAEPSPALARTIASFEAGRESLESAAAASDVRAFDAALQEARPRIDAIARQAVRAIMTGGNRAESGSFFGSQVGLRGRLGGEAVLEVGVAAGQEPDASAIVAAARAFEEKWAAKEAEEFHARLADFRVLTDAVLESANVAAKSFLASGKRTGASFVGIAVGPSAAAIAGTEARRDVGEALARAKHLNLALTLIQHENAMLKAALRREVAAVRPSSASFMGASSAATPGQYVINLQPPREDPQDIDAAIDDIMSAERAKQHAANAEFSEEKRRALEVGGLAL